MNVNSEPQKLNSEKKTDLEIKRAAQLSITEIGIGSLGHGFKIPLTGQVLSLNQLAFLLNALNRDKLSKASVFEISGIAAVLKSFSPAGQKLGPMLSICAQGFLFWTGITLFGVNIVGQLIGAILLSLWAFVQPFITLYLIYGADLVTVGNFYLKRLNEDYAFIANSLFLAVVLLLTVKLLIAIGFVIYSAGKQKEISIIGENRINALILGQIPVSRSKNAFRAALRDLFKPFFLISFILMLVFIWQFEAAVNQKIWSSLRPLATAFLLFYLLRSSWVAEKLLIISKKSPKFEKIYVKSKAVMELVAAKITQKE